jgi:hypothetical protein
MLLITACDVLGPYVSIRTLTGVPIVPIVERIRGCSGLLFGSPEN